MSQTQTAARATTHTQGADQDVAENFLRTLDESTKEATNISLLHILTLASIGASVALFFSGKKMAGIFVGLWPPTFQALKAAADNKDKR
jgi:hypothetical protein